MFDKLKGGLAQMGGEVMEKHMATIETKLKENLGPKAAELARDDEKLTSALKKVYTVLPAPLRLAVSEDKFIHFCFDHREQVIAKLI